MKLVTFAKPLAPYGEGDTRLVPDDVAAELGKGDYLSASETWPARENAKAPEKPKRPVLQPTRPAGSSDQRIAK